MSAMANALVGDRLFEQYDGFESTSAPYARVQMERNKKVGAAGELYVFELLKNLDQLLPGWGLHHWQSNIRDRINWHRDYAGLEPWGARETSDLVYTDIDGTFTELLDNKGHLDHLPKSQKPEAGTKDFIEVKTTTGPCDTPFYVSENQLRLMQEAHSAENKIRLVARVFNSNSASIGMRVYLDPEQLKESGQLILKADKYSVVPGVPGAQWTCM